MARRPAPKRPAQTFYLEYLNAAQKQAYEQFRANDLLFLVGPAGTGKTLLAMSFAIGELREGRADRIVITRPIVEAGERLGFLPGSADEKVNPYMLPLYDAVHVLCGKNQAEKEAIFSRIEVSPLAYMRGRNLRDSVIILDEAQNATYMQCKLLLTRFTGRSKVIVTGDPGQSDLAGPVALLDILERLKGLERVGFVQFEREHVVRHPLVAAILDRL